jgi:hypothetical protein
MVELRKLGWCYWNELFTELALVGAWIFLSSVWKGDTYVVKASLAFDRLTDPLEAGEGTAFPIITDADLSWG